MAGSSWQQLAGGSVNPYDVLRDDGTPTADYGQHVICDGGTVTLPSPKADKAVLVSTISQDTTVTTSTGLVEQQSDVIHPSSNSDPVLFVSDGSDWYVANNLNYLSSVPGSGDLQARYDWREASGGISVNDLTGNGNDLTGSYSGPVATIDGVQAGVFDGSDDQLTVSLSSSISEPYHVFALAKMQTVDVGRDQVIWGDKPLPSSGFSGFQDNGGWQWLKNNMSDTSLGPSDTDAHIFNWLINGPNSQLRIDGMDIATADSDSTPLDGLSVGAAADASRNGNVYITEMLLYEVDKSAIETVIEEYLDRNPSLL